MKFSGKLWLAIVLKVTKNVGFTFPLENTFLEKPRWKNWIDPHHHHHHPIPSSFPRSLSILFWVKYFLKVFIIIIIVIFIYRIFFLLLLFSNYWYMTLATYNENQNYQWCLIERVFLQMNLGFWILVAEYFKFLFIFA